MAVSMSESTKLIAIDIWDFCEEHNGITGKYNITQNSILIQTTQKTNKLKHTQLEASRVGTNDECGNVHLFHWIVMLLLSYGQATSRY